MLTEIIRLDLLVQTHKRSSLFIDGTYNETPNIDLSRKVHVCSSNMSEMYWVKTKTSVATVTHCQGRPSVQHQITNACRLHTHTYYVKERPYNDHLQL